MGGLGNQMFQYAFAKSFAKKNNAKLVLDTKTGFIMDKVFNNSFYLNDFNFIYNKLNYRHFFQYLMMKKLVNRKNFPINIFKKKYNILYEKNLNSIDSELLNYKMENNENTWLWGYFLSEDYFTDIKQDIYNDFKFQNINPKFKQVFDKYQKHNTVSIGIRMFEEVPGNSKKSVGGTLSIDFYNSCIEEINSKIDDPFFLIFSTKQFEILRKLNLKNNYIYINNDNGYNGTFNNLWLMSNSKNHIISNSSFHWWSAWFSEFKFQKPLIFAPNNFLNSNTVPNRWIKID